MKATPLILALALTGCATYHDPRETPEDLTICKKAGREARTKAELLDKILYGVLLARYFAQEKAYAECMSEKGYQTTAAKG